MVEGVDQNNVVVHHNACQSDHTDPRQERTEWTAEHQQSQQHARGRHHYRQQNESALIEIIELRNQQNEHNRQRQ